MSLEVIDAVRTGTVIGLAALAAISDLRTRKIPNRWTLPALALALVIASIGGVEQLLWAVEGLGLAVAFSVPLWALGALGGGDAKLLWAMGALLGPQGFLVALVWTALAGGALAVHAAVQRGTLTGVVKDTAALAVHAVTLGNRGHRKTLGTVGALAIPYGVAIAIGAVMARMS